MAILTAKAVKVTGRTRHALGGLDGHVVVEAGELPRPASVRIEPDEDAFLLVYLDDRGESITDTWHATLDDAKAQAAFEFDLADRDWEIDDEARAR